MKNAMILMFITILLICLFCNLYIERDVSSTLEKEHQQTVKQFKYFGRQV